MHSWDEALHHGSTHMHTTQTSQPVEGAGPAAKAASVTLPSARRVARQLLKLQLRFLFLVVRRVDAVDDRLELLALVIVLVVQFDSLLSTLYNRSFGHMINSLLFL